MGTTTTKRLLALALVCTAAATTGVAQTDPLPSWNVGKAKQAIVNFVAKVTKEGSPDFVPVAERIATFDNDGTLWAEQPLYFQVLFGIDRIKELAPQHPEWKEKEPFKSVLAGDLQSAFAGGSQSLVEMMAAGHSNMTTEEFDLVLNKWLTSATHPKTGRLYQEMVYQPMIELLAYLRANGFKTYIASGGGSDFMRGFAEKVYGIPPEQIIGSEGKLKFEMRDGKPVLIKLPALDYFATRRASPLPSKKTSAAGPSPRSAIPTAISRCCSGRVRARARVSVFLFATPTQRASGPTTFRRSADLKRVWMKPRRTAGLSST